VESRSRLAWIIGCTSLLAVSISGCSDAINAPSIQYVETEALTQDLGPDRPNLHGKPKLQDAVRKGLAYLFGPAPQEIRVPAGSPLLDGGAYLANYVQVGEGPNRRRSPIYQGETWNDPRRQRQAGGYAIYRRNCLHCHGVTGAGDGPTAPFLFPTPRDYRPGIFKFTSTPSGDPPHRDDLRRTITYGVHGTSMPAFESLLTSAEIAEVIEYVIFLSMRGQTEIALIDAANNASESDADPVPEDQVKEAAEGVFRKWNDAQAKVVHPSIARTPPTPESILRGRDIFLQADCKDCHGRLAVGDGSNFVSQDVFNEVVFGGNPSERPARIAELPDDVRKLWMTTRDGWGNPIRPANLNVGVYKGGRRPIDLYWRIAKGINGAQMPAHYHPETFNDQKIWDLVNFVLTLPYERRLLRDAPPPPPAAGPAVAAH
jgi:mono/diheme cytochrome c family protein